MTSETIERTNVEACRDNDEQPFVEPTESTGESDSTGTDDPPPICTAGDALQSIEGQLVELAERIGTMDQRHADLVAQIGQHDAESRLLSDMHEQCRALTEQFHEREVLAPIFQGLIRIADRCRNEAAALRASLDRHEGDLDLDVLVAVGHVLGGRDADRIELDALLQTYGVEAFEHDGDRFDASTQRCVKRVPTTETELRGQIAGRSLPGYRRNGTVLRPECVEVYTA